VSTDSPFISVALLALFSASNVMSLADDITDDITDDMAVILFNAQHCILCQIVTCKCGNNKYNVKNSSVSVMIKRTLAARLDEPMNLID
jgi:predicted metal-dependent RNase